MIRLTTDKHLVGPWVFDRVGKAWHAQGREAIGLIADDGTLLAGVVLEDYTGRCAQLHVALASPHVPLRKLIAATFRYAFVELGCEQVLGMVSSGNPKALMFDVKLGFEPVAIVPGVYQDGDLVIVRMLRENCRWIPASYREAA